MTSIPLAAAATLALLATPPAPFTTVKPMFYSEIVAKSELIVIGTAVRSISRRENDGATIRTYVTFANLTVKKGKTGPQLVLRLEGGQDGNDRLLVEGMPAFKVGSRYLLYVRGNGKHISPITGFSQGCFEIVRRGTREVLVSQDGRELVGVRDDRFVFAPKPGAVKPGAGAPAVGPADFTVKPADPNAEQKELAMLRAAKQRAAEQRRTHPLVELPATRPGTARGAEPPVNATATAGMSWRGRDPQEASPIVLRKDPGVRMSTTAMLNLAGQVRGR